MDRNEIAVTGRCIYQKTLDNGQVTFRLSSIVGKNECFPGFVCDAAIMPEHKAHARLSVKGHTETREIKIGDRIIKRPTLVADEVKAEDTLISKYFPDQTGIFFERMRARAVFTGTVLDISSSDGWTRYLVNVNGNSVALVMKDLERHPSIHKGDKIAVVCGISTPQKERHDKKISYIDFVVNDICVVK